MIRIYKPYNQRSRIYKSKKRPLCSSDWAGAYLFCCLLCGCVWLQEFDEILKSTSTIVVLHLTTGWEEFEGWETLDLDILELVGGGIGLGDDNVGVILKK